ncbi:protein of unknown function [Paraburkholderia kururiensis]
MDRVQTQEVFGAQFGPQAGT